VADSCECGTLQVRWRTEQFLASRESVKSQEGLCLMDLIYIIKTVIHLLEPLVRNNVCNLRFNSWEIYASRLTMEQGNSFHLRFTCDTNYWLDMILPRRKQLMLHSLMVYENIIIFILISLVFLKLVNRPYTHTHTHTHTHTRMIFIIIIIILL
jgi:hypothetical protein